MEWHEDHKTTYLRWWTLRHNGRALAHVAYGLLQEAWMVYLSNGKRVVGEDLGELRNLPYNAESLKKLQQFALTLMRLSGYEVDRMG